LWDVKVNMEIYRVPVIAATVRPQSAEKFSVTKLRKRKKKNYTDHLSVYCDNEEMQAEGTKLMHRK